MKILLTNTGSWGTGSFTVVNAIIKNLHKLNHEVKVCFPDNGMDSDDKAFYYSRPDIYHIWQFPIHDDTTSIAQFPLMITDPHPRGADSPTYRSLTQIQLDLFTRSLTIKLKTIIDDFQPDIIESQHIWLMEKSIINLGQDYIATAHHSDQMGFHYDKRMQPIAIEVAKNAEYIFSISDYVTEEVIKIYDVPQEKVITLANGYDNSIFFKKAVAKDKVLKRLNLDIDDPAILISFAGKISRTKGIDIILRANHYLPKEKNIHFLILGEGDLNKALDLEFYDLYEFARVHFIGQHIPQHVAEIHNIAKISLMPSRSEGFGIAGLEAMGCGIPLIATNSGGPKEFAVGKLIDVEDAKGLAKAILEIVDMPENDYQNLCQQAEKQAHKYSWLENVKSRLYYYQKVIDGRNTNGKHRKICRI
ncbi:MAG: glycosyltransferase family 4 protein [Pseudomonadota bacterium]